MTRNIRLVGGLMSTTRRFQWLRVLASTVFLIWMGGSVSANDQSVRDNGVEQYFWICLEDNQGTHNADGGATCCDGAACYTCSADFKVCTIAKDPSGRLAQKIELRGQRPIISPLKDPPSKGRLQSICTSVKAGFASLAGFGYSCVNPNCDGNGNNCAIICHDDNSCAAQLPEVIKHAVTLRGILQNGDNIDRSSTDSKGSDSTGFGDGGGGGSIIP
jgi:hypothetical protein